MALISACCVVGGRAPAEPWGPPADASRQESEHEASPQDWQARLRAAQDEVDEARRRHEAALEAYRVMRHRKRRRGEAKRAIIEELESSAAAVPEAEANLQELRAEARRAGVPPGWMRLQPADNRPAAPDPSAEGRFDP